MRSCSECGFTLSTSEPHCPRCEGLEHQVPEAGWTAIARFSNVAEAGFFADELASRLSCEPKLVQRDQLDPFSHAWNPSYQLLVPEGVVDEALEVLTEIISQTGERSWEPSEADSPVTRWTGNPPRPTVDSGINWVPILLTLTAGSLAIWAAKKPVPPPENRDPTEDLWKALAAHPEPWVQKIPDGQGFRLLRIDAQKRTFSIRQDLHGAGESLEQDAALQTR